MFEIQPNWHPPVVNFPIALTLTAAFFYGVALAVPGALQAPLTTAGRLVLTMAAIAVPLAWLTGFLAYGSVDHDDAAHAAMNVHRNWALVAGTMVIAAAILAWLVRPGSGTGQQAVLAGALLAAVALISVTGWYGGKLVFEHGLGVERLPETESHGHQSGAGDSDHAHDGEAMDDHSH